MWFARTQSGQEIETGKDVRIVGLDELTLIVEPLDEEITSGSDASEFSSDISRFQYKLDFERI
jgi:hypothetical protein